nr:DNA helicase [Tanacetum cinerariifolium]
MEAFSLRDWHRILFDQILIYCDVLDPGKLWIKHWQAMRDDISKKISKATELPNYHVNTAELQGYILYELEVILDGFEKYVTDFGLQSVPKLNHDQKKIYDLIIGASATNQQELLFIYGHGGTEKTLLWKTIISSLWSQELTTQHACHPSLVSCLLSLGESLPSVANAYEYSAVVAVSGVSGVETCVHTPAPGESVAQNGLPDSILSSEPKPFVQHRPHPPQSVWSPGGGMCRGVGSGGDGNAAGAMHLARRSPTEGGDTPVVVVSVEGGGMTGSVPSGGETSSSVASSPDESPSSSSPSSPPSMG